MVKVKVLKPFYDRLEKMNREVGDVFECTKERADEFKERLAEFECVDWIEIVEAEKADKVRK